MRIIIEASRFIDGHAQIRIYSRSPRIRISRSQSYGPAIPIPIPIPIPIFPLRISIELP